MKKLYVLVVGLMVLSYDVSVFAEGEDSPQEQKPSVFESSDTSKQQEPSMVFGKYRYHSDVKKLKSDAEEKKVSVYKLLFNVKDESIENQNFEETTGVHRDITLYETARDDINKEKKCNQWWDRGMGLAVGFVGAFALVGGILLFNNGSIASAIRDLATKIPVEKNEQVSAAIREGIGQIIAVLPKKDE